MEELNAYHCDSTGNARSATGIRNETDKETTAATKRNAAQQYDYAPPLHHAHPVASSLVLFAPLDSVISASVARYQESDHSREETSRPSQEYLGS
jgi:hypothetical protein